MSSFAGRFGTVVELFQFIYRQKRWWLIPLVAIILLTGLLIIFAQISGVSRFVYPGF